MFDSLAEARRLARRRLKIGRPLGAYVALLDLPDTVAREPEGKGGHHEVWGPPAALLSYVIGVVAVESETTL
jgi:hypothetical protein